MQAFVPGSEVDGFRLGEVIHIGSMATIYRLTGSDGPLPLVMKIPRLGPGERAVLVKLFEEQKAIFEKDPAAAKQLLAVGEKPADASLPPADLAAMTVLANVLFNHDEAVTHR